MRGNRAHVLAALARQLSGEVLAAGLEAAQRIEDRRARAHALSAFLPVLADPASSLRQIRHDMVHVLRSELAYASRGDLLGFCADETLFVPPIVNAPTLEAIALHIIDVTTRWEWASAAMDQVRA